MTVHSIPSFATRSWSERPGAEGGLRLAIGVVLAHECDVELVASRCEGLIEEFVGLLGISGGLACTVATTTEDPDDVVVSVHAVVRAVIPGGTEVGDLHRTGWALGLRAVEALAVTAVERVLLDDPGLLLQPDVAPIWLSKFAPHSDLPTTARELRELLSRHICLRDMDAVCAALVLADQSDRHRRLAHLTALLNDLGLVLEVPEEVSDADTAVMLDQVNAIVRDVHAFGGTFPLPPILRRSTTMALRTTNPGYARLLLAGLPLGLVGPVGGVGSGTAVADELRRATGRTLDEVTTGVRLDRLALAIPDAVAALRFRWPDVVTAEVLRAAADDLAVTDLAWIVDRLLESVGPGVPELVEHLRPDLVERHLARALGDGELSTFRVPAAIELALSAESRSASQLSATAAGEALLRAVAAQLPGSAWHYKPTAILVDSHEARRAIRKRLRPQAPDTLVLQAAELPPWVAVRPHGELQVAVPRQPTGS